MKQNKLKQIRRQRRKLGIRKRVFGTPQRPRLTVYRSLKHIYAQIVDDLSGRTLVSASSVRDGDGQAGGNKAVAAQIGRKLAERAKDEGITHVALDRNGFRYHGRVQTLAEAAREVGLQF